MTGLLVIAALVIWGFALLRLCGVRLDAPERMVVAPVVGVVTGSWLLYLLADRFGALGPPALGTACVVFVGAAIGARFRPKVGDGAIPEWFGPLVLLVVGVLVALNLMAVLAPDAGGFVAAEHVWADLPFHSSITTSFAYRDVYPPMYPLALGQPLNYPFLVDFVTGVLVRGGLSLRVSVIVVNVFVASAFLLGLALIVRRLTGSVRTALLAVCVFFFLGNLGWLAIPGDVAKADGFWDWLRSVPWSYTGDAFGDPGRERLGTGIYLGNPIFIHILPRRSAAFGMATGAALLLLLDDLVRDRAPGVAVVAGLVAGVLPRVHAHTAIAMAVVAATWLALDVRDRRRRGDALGPTVRVAALMGAIAAAIGVPEVMTISDQAQGWFTFWPGWLGEPREAFGRVASEGAGALPGALVTTLRFWVLNAGALLLLLPFALWRADARTRRWYVPFGVLFLFGFFVRTQPWEWDNNNHFFWWQAATLVVVAPLLASGLRRGRAVKAATAGAIAAMTLGGVLSFTYAAEHRLHLWTRDDMAFAADVRDVTPEDAVVLTANGHGHPVIGLSGRQTVMGFPGWFFSHGLDWSGYERDVRRMLAGDVGLMRRLGVDHVVIGPWERGYAADKGSSLPAAFDDPAVFDVVLDERVDGESWRLLRLRP